MSRASLSCHSIEHQLNFIQHLQDVSELLNDNGYYVIILPDKRYCFDHFIKESTIADIICQYTDKPKLHSIKSIIEHPNYEIDVDLDALNEYFTFQNVFSYNTLFKDITMLPPANTVIINENTFQEGKILTGRYYMKNILPKTNYLAKKILSGDKIILSLNTEQF